MAKDVQETFPFAERADESQKNAIVICKEDGDPDSFDSLLWVLRARSKDEERPNLCGLFSDGEGKFAATDGHRLHVAEIPLLTERIPAGIWLYVHADKKKVSIREAPDGIAPYPDYTKLTDLSEAHKKRGFISHIDGDDSGTLWRYWDLTGIHCNIDYLFDICKGVAALEVFSTDPAPGKISGSEPLPIFFCTEGSEGNTKKAILMPLKG
jgi:hypothetical protein